LPSKRIPRDLDAADLIRALGTLGYQVVRQSGSHVRVRTEQNGEHQETIPWHCPLKVGTLRTILSNIALHHGLTREELINRLQL
jgi:predicted RNA binding protein YcfA (HicA-like mRNA interferase family)